LFFLNLIGLVLYFIVLISIFFYFLFLYFFIEKVKKKSNELKLLEKNLIFFLLASDVNTYKLKEEHKKIKKANFFKTI